MSSEPLRPKRVCVVGAGAAGLACAWSLSKHTDKFDVHVYDKNEKAGGVCTSEDIGQGDWVNDGVQGAAPSYKNSLMWHELHGFKPSPVKLKVAFGKGETAWNNIAPTDLIRRHSKEIERFGRTLKRIKKAEWFYAFIPIRRLLSLFRFSKSFRDHLVFPLTALFFGTGNQTPHVSSVVVERVFLDPDVRLFDYDPEYLLSQQPDFNAFTNLDEIYTTIADKMPATVHLGNGITKVERRSGRQGKVLVTDEKGNTTEFDEIVFSCDADSARKILGRGARFMEKFVLGNVRYFNDISVTHEDEEYMRKHYEFDNERGDMYFVRTDPDDSEVLEMAFNLSNYQKQLEGSGRNIYQTIFLNDQIRERWTMDEIDEDKVLLKKWWKQMSHTWKHFLGVVPWVRFLQGRKHTWYCGAYTLFNTHELAVISGFAVAERLGAPYPFEDNELARLQYNNLMKVSHGIDREKRMKRAAKKEARAQRKKKD